MIKFTTTPAEAKLVAKIVTRAVKQEGVQADRTSLTMDLMAVNANGCKMDFQKLLDAPRFDFLHDIYGIQRHIERDDNSPCGGQLLDFFLPRCSAQEPSNA